MADPVKDFIDGVGGFFEDVGDGITAADQAFDDFMSGAADAVTGAISDGLNGLDDLTGGGVSRATDNLQSAEGLFGFGELPAALDRGLGDLIENTMNHDSETVETDALDAAAEGASNAVEDATDQVKEFAESRANTSADSDVVDTSADVASDAPAAETSGPEM